MDAGLAAVLGALTGAVGTALAGAAAGWAAREQARISARAEHHRQRREPREKAYRAFVAATDALVEHTDPRYGLPEELINQGRAVTRDLVEDTERLAHMVRTCWREIALLGPPEVAEASADAADAAASLKTACLVDGALSRSSPTAEQVATENLALARRCHSKLKRHILTFTEVAQRALDDDGISDGRQRLPR
jgi:hypothetical protein